MLTRRSDSILLVVAATLIIWSILLLYSRSSTNLSGEGIGKIIESNLQVRSRQSKSLTWKDLTGGSEVLDQQYVFTGDQAFAKIQLSDGPLLDIGERTLIKLSDPEKKTVTVERGVIRAFVTDDKPLEVEVDGKLISISGKNAEVLLNIQDGESEIGLASGEADLAVDNKKKKIRTNEVVNILKDPSKDFSVVSKIELTSPTISSVFYQAKNSRMVEFRWNSDESVHFEIAKDQEFKEIIFSTDAQNTIQRELREGRYYWRVKSEKAKSLKSDFTIIKEKSPEIISPKNNEIIRVVDYGTNESILLNWKEEDGPFDIELKTNDGVSLQTKITPPFELPVKKSTPLEWRVRKNINSRPETIWSSWQKNQIIFHTRPIQIKNLQPTSYEQITYGEEPRFVELKWDETQAPYEIEIKSGQHLETIQVQTNQYDYVLKTQGDYQWRVRQIDQFAREGEFSDWEEFSWKDESESLNNNAQKIVLKRPSQKVNFSWEEASGDEVQFELSKDNAFSDVVITKKLKSDSTEVTFPDQGTYYWRTQKLKTSGEKVFSKPKKVIIEPAPAPVKPESLPDIEVPLEFIESTYQKSIFDYFISSAHADEMKLIAPLSWPKKDEAEFYLIEIFSDSNGQNKIHEVKTQQTGYRWENAHIGEFYWRWAVVDYWGRVSPFSDLSLLKLLPPQNFKLGKTKLITPIRKKEILVDTKIPFQWSEVKASENYVYELSYDDDFDKVIDKRELKETGLIQEKKLSAGDYYWRVFTQKWDQRKESSTGRFSIIPEPEKVIVKKTKPIKVIQKSYSLPNSLLILSWAPSLDTLNFQTNDSEGDVSGNVLVGVRLDYQKQLNLNWRLEASLLHQSGKVFEEENYKYRHTKMGASRNISDKLTIAPSLGLVEFQEYANTSGKLKGKDQRSFDIGAELRYEINSSESKWDISGEIRGGGVLSYGAGVRRWSGKWTQALIFQHRVYDSSNFEGDQNSIRVELGRLFSFD